MRARLRKPLVPVDTRGDGGFAVAPLTVGARHVRVGLQRWVSTLVVTGYPREVHAGWLEPLTSYPGRLDVSMHVELVDPTVAAGRLRRRLAQLESARRSDAEHGRLLDPHDDAATEDAYSLFHRLARGEGKLFQVGLSLTVYGDDERDLARRVDEVRALAASLLIDARPTAFRAANGWITGLPLGLERLHQTRTFDTDALAAAFPFASAELPTHNRGRVGAGVSPGGVLYGHNLASPSLVFWDRFGCDNYNAVVLGRSGAGKSYLVKLELLRSLYRGVEAHVIDPEDEYRRLADAVGGAVIRPGAPGVHINPFDLPLSVRNGRITAPRDALARRTLFLHTFLAVLLGEPVTAIERAVLDTAITTTYRHAGITPDPASWTRPAPLLTDLRATLNNPALNDPGLSSGDTPAGAGASAAAAATRLAAMLHPFTEGSFAEPFAAPTSTQPDAHLVVWSLRELPEELRAVGTLLVLDAIWSRATNPDDRWPRMIVVDEAWLLMQQPAGAQFLLRAVKAGRKHWVGLTIATQDTSDVLASDAGKALITNAATQILLRQAPQAIDTAVDTFNLTDGERDLLLSADKGHALLCAGRHRVAFHAIAADAEHRLITTDPAELATHTHSLDDPDADGGWTDDAPSARSALVDLGPA
ncbi:VirB4 family type IV secretion system protein [Pseudonocardia sp. TRM90224]|uniref:VirB4 family type IV secretion system protein n=1 Tax=Pseudonocardia sp. TRM90224 TaxID=2812678 RepID=UPI003F90B814